MHGFSLHRQALKRASFDVPKVHLVFLSKNHVHCPRSVPGFKDTSNGVEINGCVNNLPIANANAKKVVAAARPGIEPATSRSRIRRPNHYATTYDTIVGYL